MTAEMGSVIPSRRRISPKHTPGSHAMDIKTRTWLVRNVQRGLRANVQTP